MLAAYRSLERSIVKAMALTAIAAAITLFSGGSAEARIFEPQPNWWNSGRTCAASREPAGRRWNALPARSCRSAEPDAEIATAIRDSRKAKARSDRGADVA
ncbi:hypothetical protein [Terricaulis silvestris]|uniref:Uncharacterized protein n=1 Tax=Terricaulis silvestris TaxID=2686094 RepID=A0A6I6MPM4_9CAUL|nr:hypothetical protein [Terricaulis silvestris]QGZ95306.1 hypothetical protein DSM104635_02155 [Terricaulis silvestris]